MGTRSETAFMDGSGHVLAVLYCQWDGGPDMAWGDELSSVLCLQGRDAKMPEAGELERKLGTFRSRPCGDGCEEALDCVRLLKALSPVGDRRLDWNRLKLRKGGAKSVESRAADALVQPDPGGDAQWRYAVILPEGSGPAKILVSEGASAPEFSGTPEEFRKRWELGEPKSLRDLWTDAAASGAPLRTVPLGMVCPEVCLAAVKRNPLEIGFVPDRLLSPEICRACAEGCVLGRGTADPDRLEETSAAVMDLLLERKAPPEALKAAGRAFAVGIADLRRRTEKEEEPRP